jgi:hypothetical protein
MRLQRLIIGDAGSYPSTVWGTGDTEPWFRGGRLQVVIGRRRPTRFVRLRRSFAHHSLVSAHDIGLDNEIGRPAYHDQVLDVVAPHEQKTPPAVDGGGLNHAKPGLSIAGGRRAQSAPAEQAYPPRTTTKAIKNCAGSGKAQGSPPASVPPVTDTSREIDIAQQTYLTMRPQYVLSAASDGCEGAYSAIRPSW